MFNHWLHTIFNVVPRFSPKKWGLSGSSAAVLAAFLAGVSFLLSHGIDIRPNLAVLLGLAFLDSIFLGGCCVAQISSYWPPFRRRILVHEAGHLLVGMVLLKFTKYNWSRSILFLCLSFSWFEASFAAAHHLFLLQFYLIAQDCFVKLIAWCSIPHGLPYSWCNSRSCCRHANGYSRAGIFLSYVLKFKHNIWQQKMVLKSLFSMVEKCKTRWYDCRFNSSSLFLLYC